MEAKLGGDAFLQGSEYRRRSRFGGAGRKEQGRFESLHFGQIEFQRLGERSRRDIQP